MERAAAKKKQSDPENVNASTMPTNGSQMQSDVFQGHSSSGTGTDAPEGPEPVRTEPPEPVRTKPPEPVREDDETESSNYGIKHDPSYAVNDQDCVRRAYIALEPCQPNMKNEDFAQHNCGGMRRFQPKWFDEFKWLEYSTDKDAFYLVCYLFKDSCIFRGGDAFVDGGFQNWNMKVRFRRHAGAIDGAHSKAEEKYNMFIRPKASIRDSLKHQSTRLNPGPAPAACLNDLCSHSS